MARIFPEFLVKALFYAVFLLGIGGRSKAVVLPYLELCITTKCSLKCSNCANLMQFYENPIEYDTERIIASVDKLVACVDSIDRFRILGGEPFLHGDIARIISHCARQGKLRHVEVVTNGTMVPKEEVLLALKHDKVSVYISDYGSVSRNLSKLQSCLAQRGIAQSTDTGYFWIDMGGLHRRDYSAKRVRQVYRDCKEICKTMLDGAIFVCPRSAHGDKLGLVPKSARDQVDIFSGPVPEIREKLRALYNTEYLEACYYCNAVEDRCRIAPGEQSKELPNGS